MKKCEINQNDIHLHKFTNTKSHLHHISKASERFALSHLVYSREILKIALALLARCHHNMHMFIWKLAMNIFLYCSVNVLTIALQKVLMYINLFLEDQET